MPAMLCVMQLWVKGVSDLNFATVNGTKDANYEEIKETNFSIYNELDNVYTGSFPYQYGDVFPTDKIQKRANRYKTNKYLYSCKYSEIYPNLINFNDVWKKPLSNWPILQLLPNLPDYREITETNVDLLAAKQPKIDGDFEVDKLNRIILGSNFTSACQDIIRNCIRYGNDVKRLSFTPNGLKIVDMPVKCWEPWVNENDSTEIECNLFFNIFKQDGVEYVEFISYLKDGTVEKRKFIYRNGKLGDLVEEYIDKPYEISPIIVFTGYSIDGSVLGEDLYKYWEAAIAASIRAFGVILQLLERTKDITKIMPASASQRDETSGATYDSGSDTILYEDLNNPVKVEYVSPTLMINEAIAIYELSLKRLSRDTSLSFSMYDTKELGSNASGKSLKMSMYKTELRATTFKTSIIRTLKELIYKAARFYGIEVDYADMVVTWESGFIQDDEELTNIVNARNGGIPTLSLEDSIAILDDLTPSEAKKKAEGILSLVKDKNETQGITEPIVSNLNETMTRSDEIEETERVEPTVSPFGGSDIDAN